MIRGSGVIMSSAYSQTLNGYELGVASVNPAVEYCLLVGLTG